MATIGSKEFIYRKPTDILQLVLDSPTAHERFRFHWDYNDGKIQHSNNTDGWLDLLAFFWKFAIAGYDTVVNSKIYMINTCATQIQAYACRHI